MIVSDVARAILAALFILNSAAETAKEAVDALRKKGLKVGLVRPNVIRPFPIGEVRAILKNVKGLVVADRQDNFGAYGGAMAIEVKAALQGVKGNTTQVAARVYGTGGKEFFVEDAEAMLHEDGNWPTGARRSSPCSSIARSRSHTIRSSILRS
jgi:pyruvate/2-oxoacid:ferredoxin oxidoreductase alpha subunit